MELERESRWADESEGPQDGIRHFGHKQSLLGRTRVSLDVRHYDLLRHTQRHESTSGPPILPQYSGKGHKTLP